MGKIGAFRKVLVLASIILLTGEAGAATCLYDDFSGPYINSQKWTELDFVREIQDGGLTSKIRAVTTSTSWVRNLTDAKNLDPLTSIQSDVKIIEIKIESGNNTMGCVYTQAAFYNAQFAAPADATGDIWGTISMADYGNGLEARFYINEFLDGAYEETKEIDWGVLVAPGILSYGTFYTAKITYDGNTGFTFSINGYPEATGNGPERKGNVFRAYKQLQTSVWSSVAGSDLFVFAVFDNIYIDGILYDDFDSSQNLNEKWMEKVSAREIANGKLHMNLQGYGNGTTDIRENLMDSDAPCFNAKIKVESGTTFSPGAEGQIQVGGFFYNDTYGPGTYNQCVGEVWISTRLQIDENEQIQALAMAHRSTNTTCTAWAEVFSPHSFSVPINLDTEHILSVELSGNDLIFKCDAETYVHNVTTALNLSNVLRRSFITRLYLDAGESGYLKSTFDDVYVCCEGTPVFVSKKDSTCAGNSPCYSSIQDAIAGTGTEDIVINVSEGEYNEAPTLDQSKTVTIKGGWNSAFSSQTADKTFIKAPKVTQGAIKAQMLTVEP